MTDQTVTSVALPKLARETLHVDPDYQSSVEEDMPPVSASPTPSTNSLSPVTPLTGHSGESEQADDSDAVKEPASGPLRGSRGGPKREKRKRCRVTPDQLVSLEEIFCHDRNPTAIRRREISDELGMQERQTQIWFQNRRAKAKLLDGKARSSPDSPGGMHMMHSLVSVNLPVLVNEPEAFDVIPCYELSVGSWRRIASPSAGQYDLIAYTCDAKQSITWFIQSVGRGFKMELAYSSIVGIDFTHASPGTGSAVFIVNRPPTFYLEQFYQPESVQPAPRFWKRCGDWTEGFQGSKVLAHTLSGPAAMLDNIVRNLRARILAGGALAKNDMIPRNPMGQYLPTSTSLVESHSDATVPYFVKQPEVMAQPQPVHSSIASMASFATSVPVTSRPLYGVSGYADDLELAQDRHYAVPISRGARMISTRPSQSVTTVSSDETNYFSTSPFDSTSDDAIFSQGMFSSATIEPSLMHVSPYYDANPGEDIFGSLFDDHTVTAGVTSMPQMQYRY